MIRKSLVGLIITAVASAVLVLVMNFFQVYMLKQSDFESAQVSLQLLMELYMPLVILRFLLLGFGLICFVSCPLEKILYRESLGDMIGMVYFSCLFVLVGEILERFLFYAVHVRIGI